MQKDTPCKQLQRKIRRRDKAFKLSKVTGRLSDERKFQKLKQEVQRDLRRAYWQQVEELIMPKDSDEGNNSMKRFYKFIKHQKMDHNGVSPLKVDGILVSDPSMKAEALNKQFKSVFINETDFKPDKQHPQYPSTTPINITAPGVLKLLQGLNPTKAPGPDNLSPRVLKEFSLQIAEPLAILFQKSLTDGEVPVDWRRANVVPIFKKEQKYSCANYRPISLTCIISKVMEHIIVSNIMSHATNPVSYTHLTLPTNREV